jgi:hypothetical protein
VVLSSEMCELEPRSQSLTGSLLEGMKEKGSKGGRERGKINCLISWAKNGEGYLLYQQKLV